VTTPAASGTLYATVADLRAVMAGSDNGAGTASQLSPEQLTLALYAASNRVSVYAGNVYDGSTPEAVPPPILHDLTLDLAVFWATKTYLKYKEIPNTSPVYIAYQNAMSILQDVRAGKIFLSPAEAPGPDPEDMGRVINRIPGVFTRQDSNTRINPMTGGIEAETAPGMGWDFTGGPVYQG
jgi:phage gp36-like protein